MKRLSLHFLLCLYLCCTVCVSVRAKECVDYVNNRIGNISLLLVPTFPTSHLPNGMLRMNPGHQEFINDRTEGLPLNVPSHRQGHVLLLQPYCGPVSGLASLRSFTYDQEVTRPESYSVVFDEYGIACQFVPSRSSALCRFTFEQAGHRFIALRTAGRGELTTDGRVMKGYEDYHGIRHYFYLEFSEVPERITSDEIDGHNRLVASFGDGQGQVSVRYGISYIDEVQARRNLEREVSGFDLRLLLKQARNAWNEVLGKIQVKGATEDQLTVFYTALYRAHERMICISEDGRYFNGFDGRVHSDEGTPFWTDDWIWDTYLALHPLHCLLHPKAESEKIASYLRMFEASGWVPTFPCVFGDAHCMNGNHAAVMMSDALAKGIPFDVSRAAQAMKKTVLTESMIPWYRGDKTVLDDFYREHGWFPALCADEKETCREVTGEKRQAVAVTLAACYDDWAIARLFRAAGQHSDEEYFNRRSFNYRHLFHPQTLFFHPKDADGNFIEPFDYVFSGGLGARDYYDENNAWTYNWQVQHNVADLIQLFGGAEPFVRKLDQLFDEGLHRSKWQYYAVLPDATGNVGQFVMGNEPSFHIPYLYCYAGQPWKTQKRIRMLLESWFRNDLMGICGDEDGGGMSAFCVFSSLGIYPVVPGLPYYVIGSPLFERSQLCLEGGKTFTIVARNVSHENKYIQSARLNGKPYNKVWISHQDVVSGGKLELVMGPRPNKSWAASSDALPPSFDLPAALQP